MHLLSCAHECECTVMYIKSGSTSLGVLAGILEGYESLGRVVVAGRGRSGCNLSE